MAENNSMHVSSGQRSIKSGLAYDNYFPKPDTKDRIIIKDGEVEDTVALMEKVVWKYLTDTKKIASLLKRNSVDATCKAIWEFLYHHLQYALDKQGLEQLRRPARSWQERRTGVDCDCMSIFASSILTNLNIPHSFRITKYSAEHWQHVYVIVPIAGTKNHYTIDAVVSAYNFEKTYSEKMDYPMSLKGINVAVLSGIAGDDLTDAILATGLTGLGETNDKQDLDKLYQHLVSTRNAVAKDPTLVSSVDDATALLKMLDYAIQYWYTDKRSEALAVLEKNEEKLNLRNGFSLSGDDDDNDSLSGGKKKGFFGAIAKAANAVGKGVKAATKLIVRFNPLTIAARNGFLLAMKLNIGKMAKHLKWAYATKEQALAKGVSVATWEKAKNALSKIENLYADKLQGKRSALQNAILKGKAGNLNGVVEYVDDGLGDPASGSAIAAATSIILAAVQIIKKAGASSGKETVDANSIAQEFASDPSASSMLRTTEQENSSDSGADAPSSSASSASRSAKPSDDTAKPPNKIVAFIKANPVPVVIGGGILAFGLYKIMQPPSVKKNAGLSGTKKIKSGTAHHKKKKVHAHSKKKLPIKSHTLL